jgi:hypothetical protein
MMEPKVKISCSDLAKASAPYGRDSRHKNPTAHGRVVFLNQPCSTVGLVIVFWLLCSCNRLLI